MSLLQVGENVLRDLFDELVGVDDRVEDRTVVPLQDQPVDSFDGLAEVLTQAFGDRFVRVVFASASGQPLATVLDRQIEPEDLVGAMTIVEADGLRLAPRIAVEYPSGYAGVLEGGHDQGVDIFVRNQCTAHHVFLHTASELGLGRHLLTNQVAGADVGETEMLRQEFGLGRLAGALRARDHNSCWLDQHDFTSLGCGKERISTSASIIN